MIAPDDSTRPISVAELLARNGTIGSPPVGGRRRRSRRNAGVSVSELTGEIPVIRTGEIPVVSAEETDEYPEGYAASDETVYAETVYEDVAAGETVYAETAYAETAYVETAHEGTVYEGTVYAETVYEDVAAGETVYAETAYVETAHEGTVYEGTVYEETVYEDVAAGETVYAETAYAETAYVETAHEGTVYEETVYEDVAAGETVYVEAAYQETVYEDVPADDTVYVYAEVPYAEAATEQPVIESSETVVVHASAAVPEYTVEAVPEEDGAGEFVLSPPLASDPLPRRSDGPQLGYDPRPLRRSSGAEQMSFDPVDESVNLDDLLHEHVEDVEHLRSYLRAPQDTLFSGEALFSGETVAEDLALRSAGPADAAAERDMLDSGPPGAVWNAVLAVVQSLAAVVLGAALFIGFDQLWRWNRLVALILSVLVVLSLAAAVRIVRKTEDIVSTLTAVAVGLLVTLGPLALQST